MRDLHTGVRDVLNYSPKTGIFTWRVSNGCRKTGDIAGHIDDQGRPRVQVFGKRYMASRLAWFWMTGAWPKNEIDHINRDWSDNRWANLREATRSQNTMNMSVASRSKTGIKGVWFVDGRYRAEIMRDGKRHYLGRFKTKEAARQAYIDAAEKLHGEFAHV